MQKGEEGKPVSVGVVNMLVPPEQAEILSLASNETRIQLILRNPLDKELTKTSGTAMAYLFNGSKPSGASSVDKPPQNRVAKKVAPPPKPPAPPPTVVTERVIVPITVEMIHGASKAETKFKPEDKDKEKDPKSEDKL